MNRWNIDYTSHAWPVALRWNKKPLSQSELLKSVRQLMRKRPNSKPIAKIITITQEP